MVSLNHSQNMYVLKQERLPATQRIILCYIEKTFYYLFCFAPGVKVSLAFEQSPEKKV